MRSGKLDLDGVVDRFEGWRANKQGRLIPAELWRAAIGLLDRYSPSVICRRLRVSPARFKEVRESGAWRGPARGGRRRAPGPQPAPAAMVPASQAFLEFPALGMAITGAAGASGRCDAPPASAAGCRLVLESAKGTLTLFTRAPDDGELVDAVCRLVLGAMGDGDAKP